MEVVGGGKDCKNQRLGDTGEKMSSGHIGTATLMALMAPVVACTGHAYNQANILQEPISITDEQSTGGQLQERDRQFSLKV